MWLQPPFFWMGVPQPAQGLVCVATQDSLCEAAFLCASRTMACHSRACTVSYDSLCGRPSESPASPCCAPRTPAAVHLSCGILQLCHGTIQCEKCLTYSSAAVRQRSPLQEALLRWFPSGWLCKMSWPMQTIP